jgi:hypothetical protein
MENQPPLAVSLSPRRPGSGPGQSKCKLWWNKCHWGRLFFLVPRFPPVSIIPPWLSTLIYHVQDEQGPSVAAVQRHRLTPTTWTTTSVLIFSCALVTSCFTLKWTCRKLVVNALCSLYNWISSDDWITTAWLHSCWTRLQRWMTCDMLHHWKMLFILTYSLVVKPVSSTPLNSKVRPWARSRICFILSASQSLMFSGKFHVFSSAPQVVIFKELSPKFRINLLFPQPSYMSICFLISHIFISFISYFHRLTSFSVSLLYY